MRRVLVYTLRFVLYADAYGLTRARVFGFIFLIWLSIILIIFLFRIFGELKQKWLFTSTFILD